MVDQIGRTLGKTIGGATHSLERAIGGLGLPTRFRRPKPGAAPGIEHHELKSLPSTAAPIYITCIDYAPDNVQVQNVMDIDSFIAGHRPEWSVVRWINVDGLTDMNVIHALAQKYELHPLAIEDVLHLGQRPKIESYGGAMQSELRARLFVVARMLQIIDGRLHSEQIAMFLGHKTVLTFQETRGDVWDPIRARINTKGSRLRANDASFLVYGLLDAIIDHCFPILEHYGDRLEELEDLVLEKPTRHTIQEIHHFKRHLLLLRRALWPMREVIHSMQREAHECMSENTRTYLRDVYDHTVQIIDIIETYREVATGLTETYMSSLSIRLNEVMKVLTIIGTIFIPLTFLAGVYGMNFRHMPEMDQPWAYPAFWGVCVVTAGGMLAWFKRRQWL